MGCFPFFIELEGRSALIVGGGPVALRKAKALLPYGPAIRAAAPDFCPGFEALEGVELLRRPFGPELLEGQFLVVAATGDKALNETISTLCREKNILVNVVDSPSQSGFYFPALVRRGKLTLGISTQGASPTAAKVLARRLEGLLPPRTEEILAALEESRERLKQALVPEVRSKVYARLLGRSLALGRPLTQKETDRLAAQPQTGQVALVGAGCGGVGWLTLEGLEWVTGCDALVYDALLDPAIITLAGERCRLYPVGKRRGCHSASQEEINRLLVELAGQGLTVTRLKGGDPLVFGRGGEEIQALEAAGIPWHLVPGVSSAIAIPGQAGIPVTHRGLARSVHLITAQADTPDGFPPDLDRLAQLEGTLVFLMGLAKLEELARRLMAAGMDPDTPAAVVSGGNAPHPAQVRGTLVEIAPKTRAAGVSAPAVILVGKTVGLALGSKP